MPMVFQHRFQAVEKFESLLHDGEVCGEIGVEHGGKPEPPQRRHHPPRNQRPRLQAETLAQRGPHRRRRLDHNRLGLVIQGRPDELDIAFLGKRPHRAYRRALPALHTRHRVEVGPKGRANHGLEPAELREQRPHRLDLSAYGNTPPALDALALVPHHAGRAGIHTGRRLHAGVSDCLNIQLIGQRLEFAVVVAVTGLAIPVMLREQKLDHRAPRLTHPLGVGGDFHPLRHRHDTGGRQRLGAFDLHHADPARANGVDILQMAQRGDPDAHLVCRLEN